MEPLPAARFPYSRVSSLGTILIASLAASDDMVLAHLPFATGIAGIVLAVGAISAFILTPTGS